MCLRPRNAGAFRPCGKEEEEPIGTRILEIPVDPDATETYRNPRSGWIAYVPVGSIKRGEDRCMSGGARRSLAPRAMAKA